MEVTKKWNSAFHKIGNPAFVFHTAKSMRSIVWTPVIREQLRNLGIKLFPGFFDKVYATRYLYLKDSKHPLLDALLYAYLEYVLLLRAKNGDLKARVPAEISNVITEAAAESKGNTASLLNCLFSKHNKVFTKLADYLNDKFLDVLPEGDLEEIKTEEGEEKLMAKEGIGARYFAEVAECHIEIYDIEDNVMGLRTIPDSGASAGFKLKLLRLSNNELYILYSKEECELYKVPIINISKEASDKMNFLRTLIQNFDETTKLIRSPESENLLGEAANKQLLKSLTESKELLDEKLKDLAEQLKDILQ